jgi:hypothetical protein
MSIDSLPNFLKDYGSFRERVDAELSGKSTVEKGDSFNRLITKVLPLCEEWGDFGIPVPRDKKSHDGGIDFVSEKEENDRMAAGQSKLRIPSRDELDSVVSKFQEFESKVDLDSGNQMNLALDLSDKDISYYIVTLSRLSNIISKYKRSSLSSKNFYKELEDRGRIDIIDGNRIYNELKSYYNKTFNIPSDLSINTQKEYIKSEDVYLTVVSVGEVKKLFRKHGTSLFFENIRDFLGVEDNNGVNSEIMDTLSEEPEMMLNRNNGLTLKAKKVEEKNNKNLRLKKAGIVNGCQTTMCIVNSDVDDEAAQVPVKIVTSGESWDVAKSANHQNDVSQIDLDLAQYLRPQLIQKVATDIGYSVEGSSDQSVTDALNEIHDKQFRYSEIRHLFLGIFSTSPTNLFDKYYNKLRIKTLDNISDEGDHEYVLEVLLRLVHATQKASERVRSQYKDNEDMNMFSRFFKPDKVGYRSFFSILSCCVCTQTDISNIKSEESFEELREFISEVEVLLISDTEKFVKSYVSSVESIASYILLEESDLDEGDIRQKLNSKVTDSKFSNLYKATIVS